MPVRKFRDISEMPDTRWRRPGDPDLFRTIAGCWEMARRLTKPRFPPGVYKHRCSESAQEQRARWHAAACEGDLAGLD